MIILDVSPMFNFTLYLTLKLHLERHGWELPVLHYHEIMVIYPYPFLVVITPLIS